jgi:uncharacterized protein
MNIPNLEDPPVTVDVLRQVKPGCEEAFESVLKDLLLAAQSFDGHLGVNVFRPSDRTHPEYRVIFKFDHLSNLKQWENSPIRNRLLERVNRLTLQNEPQGKVITGLETWFTLPSQDTMIPPPRYKMLVITALTIFPLINLMNSIFQPLLQGLPALLRSLVITVVTVWLMTYVAMPRMTKLFAGWLYPKPKR